MPALRWELAIRMKSVAIWGAAEALGVAGGHGAVLVKGTGQLRRDRLGRLPIIS